MLLGETARRGKGGKITKGQTRREVYFPVRFGKQYAYFITAPDSVLVRT
jgi:hypothetical protein